MVGSKIGVMEKLERVLKEHKRKNNFILMSILSAVTLSNKGSIFCLATRYASPEEGGALSASPAHRRCRGRRWRSCGGRVMRE